MEIDSVIRIPVADDKDFYVKWLSFLRPIHNMTNTDMSIVASFIKKRSDILSKKNDVDIDEEMKKRSVVKEIMDECGMEYHNFSVYMNRLRKGGIIVDGVINKKLIPNVKKGKKFIAVMYFDKK